MTTALHHGDCRRCDVNLRGSGDAAVVDGEHNKEQVEQRLNHLFLSSIAYHAFILVADAYHSDWWQQHISNCWDRGNKRLENLRNALGSLVMGDSIVIGFAVLRACEQPKRSNFQSLNMSLIYQVLGGFSQSLNLTSPPQTQKSALRLWPLFPAGSQFFGRLNAKNWFQSRHWLWTGTRDQNMLQCMTFCELGL